MKSSQRMYPNEQFDCVEIPPLSRVRCPLVQIRYPGGGRRGLWCVVTAAVGPPALLPFLPRRDSEPGGNPSLRTRGSRRLQDGPGRRRRRRRRESKLAATRSHGRYDGFHSVPRGDGRRVGAHCRRRTPSRQPPATRRHPVEEHRPRCTHCAASPSPEPSSPRTVRFAESPGVRDSPGRIVVLLWKSIALVERMRPVGGGLALVHFHRSPRRSRPPADGVS